jgi:hypothetical protein
MLMHERRIHQPRCPGMTTNSPCTGKIYPMTAIGKSCQSPGLGLPAITSDTVRNHILVLHCTQNCLQMRADSTGGRNTLVKPFYRRPKV